MWPDYEGDAGPFISRHEAPSSYYGFSAVKVLALTEKGIQVEIGQDPETKRVWLPRAHVEDLRGEPVVGGIVSFALPRWLVLDRELFMWADDLEDQ